MQTLQTQGGRKRLNQFVPLLINALMDVENPSETLDRVLQLVEAILRRTAYMVLLMENPGAMTQLVRLCSESPPWIARLLADTPLLLDELLNAESLYSPPAKEELQDDLRQQMLRIPYEDLEEQMEALRYFKKAHVLRVAASELKGTLPLMKVSDYLTWIAEVVLDHVVDVAFSNLVSRHGYPRRADAPPVIPISPSSVTASSAVSSWATPQIWIWCLCTRLILNWPPMATSLLITPCSIPGSASESCTFSVPRHPPGSSTKWICDCAPPRVTPACW